MKVFQIFATLSVIVCVLFMSVPASADETQTMKFVKSMGTEYVSGTGSCHKIMVQSYASGKRWFVWYYNSLGIDEGDNVLITFGGYNNKYWRSISNLKNGKWTKVKKVLEVN